MKVKLQLDLKKGFRELERRGGRGKEECVFKKKYAHNVLRKSDAVPSKLAHMKGRWEVQRQE